MKNNELPVNENLTAGAVADAAAAASSAAPVDMEAYLNEYVSVKLFRDNDKYKEPVYVAVNGKNCVIKRGEWVKVKRKFALVLDQSEIQDLRTAEMIASESEKFLCASRCLGL